MSVEHRNVGAAIDDDRAAVLRESLADSQLERLRRAAQSERFVVRCQATSSRCRTDGDGYLGTFATSACANDAIEAHDHPAMVVEAEWPYVALCLTDGCSGLATYERVSDARDACLTHDTNLHHDPVFGRASRLVADLDGGWE